MLNSKAPILTDDENLAMMCRKIGGHGFKNLKAEEGRVRLRQETFQNPNYKRHDVLGWNYRLSEFNAAIALAQLEKHELLIKMRTDSAKIFLDEMSDVDYLIPQITPEGYENSYYTLGVKFEGADLHGITWEQFRQKYIELGGDGIYGAWAIPYLEPVVKNNQYAYRNPSQYQGLHYPIGTCPVAESIQPKIMQFKTNYRDLELCKQKASALKNTIKYFKN